jgi:two-component system sensor histidine kinase HydH
MSSHLVLRIIAPTIAVSVLLLLLSGAAAWYLHRLDSKASARLTLDMAKVEAIDELGTVSRELRSHISHFLLTGEAADLEAIADLHRDATQRLGVAESLADTPREADTSREHELIAQIRQGYDRCFADLHGVTDPAAPADRRRQAGLDLLRDVTSAQILRPIDKLRELNGASMAKTSRENELIADRMGLTLLLLGTCGAAAGLLLGFGIARSIHRSIIQLQVPIHDAAGRLSEVVGPIVVSPAQGIQGLDATLQNVSQRVGEVVKRLEESQRAAWRSEQLAALGRLAAGLAHEIRNPLASMRVLIQAAAEQGASGVLEGQDLEVLAEEILRLDRSFQAFIDYAQFPRPNKHPLQLRKVLEQTIRLVSSRAATQGIRIECELPQEPVPIEADADQMRQVFLNLLLNGMDAAPSDGVIHVRMHAEAAPGRKDVGSRQLVIQVSDSGAGLDPQVKDRIFEPFVTTKQAGTGLGLSICRRIVEEHGGQIDAQNQPEGGAVFTVRLPIRTASGGQPSEGGLIYPTDRRGN